jgi:hypothetical protein
MGVTRNAYTTLIAETEGKRALESKCRWDENIKMDFKDRECKNVDCIILG